MRTQRLPALALRVAALAAALAPLACGQPPSPTPGSSRQEAVAPRVVRTAAVTVLAGAGSTAPGAVLARERATLTARFPATVRDLPFEEGAAVRAGDVVARLDDDALRAALAAAEAARLAARSDADRLARLRDRQAATPREAEAASARAAAATAEVAAARDAVAHAVLRAPFAGRLADRLVSEGDVVVPGQPLVAVEGDRGYELRAAVPGAEAAALSPGAEVGAVVDGVGEVGAVVRAVSPAGDPGTQRFEVIADLDRRRGCAPGCSRGCCCRPPPGARRSSPCRRARPSRAAG